MLKPGISRREQFSRQQSRALDRVALTLLRTEIPAAPGQIELFESVMAHLRLSSGVYRTTFRGRFANLDGFLNDHLRAAFDPTVAVRIEDWAVSDCLTSSEWALSVLRLFPNATLTASDLTLFLVEACLPDGTSYILEADGEPLQFIRPPLVIRMNPPEPRSLPANRFFERRARRRLETLRRQWSIPRDWLDLQIDADLAQAGCVLRKIPLVHPQALALRQTMGHFRIRRHSVFEAAPLRCDVIRTMNIFNLCYFSEERLLEGARAVALSLREGGLWIVGRTFQQKPPDHNVSILLREGRGFRLIDRFGAGSEIEQLVLSRLDTPAAA